MNKAERKHLGIIKSLPCGNCHASAPSAAHHITEGNRRISHYATIPLCYECHQGNQGIHGDKRLWLIMKNSELKVLANTMEALSDYRN